MKNLVIIYIVGPTQKFYLNLPPMEAAQRWSDYRANRSQAQIAYEAARGYQVERREITFEDEFNLSSHLGSVPGPETPLVVREVRLESHQAAEALFPHAGHAAAANHAIQEEYVSYEDRCDKLGAVAVENGFLTEWCVGEIAACHLGLELPIEIAQLEAFGITKGIPPGDTKMTYLDLWREIDRLYRENDPEGFDDHKFFEGLIPLGAGRYRAAMGS